MYLNYKLYSLNGGLAFMSGSMRLSVFCAGAWCIFTVFRGLCESVQVLLGGLMSTYLNEYVFELYNLSASVPESYIAQMVDIFGRWAF